MAAVPGKYPPPVPVRRTGAQATEKRTPQKFAAIPLQPVPPAPHATEHCELDEKPRLEEISESIVREKLPLSAYGYEGQDYPREVEPGYENIRPGRRQVEEAPREIRLLEEPIAQQQTPPLLSGASESAKPEKSSDRGRSVFEITQKDADNFKETSEPYYDGARPYRKPWLERDFSLGIKIIWCISCLLCLWPFTCICLCCAYCCSLRVSACMHAYACTHDKKIINNY